MKTYITSLVSPISISTASYLYAAIQRLAASLATLLATYYALSLAINLAITTTTTIEIRGVERDYDI